MFTTTVNIPKDHIWIKSDHTRLRQMMNIIVSNTIKFTFESGASVSANFLATEVVKVSNGWWSISPIRQIAADQKPNHNHHTWD